MVIDGVPDGITLLNSGNFFLTQFKNCYILSTFHNFENQSIQNNNFASCICVKDGLLS
jgi:hypothetical protein